MFSLDSWFRSPAPCPPIPMPAIFSFSLGGFSPPPPSTPAGSTINVAEANAAWLIKVRRFWRFRDDLGFIDHVYPYSLSEGQHFFPFVALHRLIQLNQQAAARHSGELDPRAIFSERQRANS